MSARIASSLLPVLLALLAACASPPPLPKVDTSRFSPAVRHAIEAAQAAAVAAPDDAARALSLGMTLHAHQQLDAAIAAYRRAITQNPALPHIHYLLGVALLDAGRPQAAVEPLRRAAASHGAPAGLKLAAALLASGDPAAARRQYQALIDAGSPPPQALVGVAQTLDDTEAEPVLRQALALFPAYGKAQFLLANLLRRRGLPAAAVQLLSNYEHDKSLQPPLADPVMDQVAALAVNAAALLRRARFLDDNGQTADALALHEQAVALEPGNAGAWINLISLYGRTGRPQKAEDAYKKAIALAPGRAEAYYNFGVLCTERHRLPEARAAFQKALGLDPRHARAAHNLGQLLAATGNLNGAAALYRQAIAVDPSYRLARFHLAQILVSRKNYRDAAAHLEKILEPADAETPAYRYALGATQFRAGQAAQARATLLQALGESRRFHQPALAASIEKDLRSLP